MSISGTFNASQSLSSSQIQKINNKSDPNFFTKIDSLSNQLSELSKKLNELGQECISIRMEKQSVDKYLEKKSQQNRLRLMGELELFQVQVKRKIENSRKQTQTVDQIITQLKQSQLYTIQMILSLQRSVHELEVQLGTEQSL